LPSDRAGPTFCFVIFVDKGSFLMKYHAGIYDVVVIGAGHAGIEAALAAARLGCSTCVFTINMDAVGNCPCNPSIGGTAKGHLVREIDALGGEMGKTADACTIQSRMLNLGKGPAVHSLRAQIDRREYGKIMKHKLELQPNLQLKQAEIVDVIRNDDGTWQVVTRMDAVYQTKAVVIATGTFLAGKIYLGDVAYASGPDGMFPAAFLSEPLRRLGLRLRRFKTGTPARVLKSSIDFTGLEEQKGDEPIVPFSYDTLDRLENRAVCHISWTNEETKRIILENIHRSPLYGGKIEGVGPRYCPSIEDKIVRFSDKQRHQLFIEPCGMDTEEMYLQGMSSSLPEDVQLAFYRSIPGLEQVQIMRSAYAIEYDCVDPVQMSPMLEFRDCPGLYGAGQFNGSSGYEEAAAQGLVAGVNAALKVLGKEPMVLDRESSYIGTLVDDLITKGVTDPYRMMTSRSEYRLVLRQDNADERLTPVGRRIGLISDERWARFQLKEQQKKQETERAEKAVLPPSEALNELLVSHGTSPVSSGVKLADLIRRPELNYEILAPVDTGRPELPAAVFENVEIELKYQGYIKRQKADIAEARRLEERSLPADMDYREITGLRTEAQEKLNKVKPASIGQASRISGVSPADISVLLVWLTRSAARA
jgi:glucose-inhibited division protein A